MKLKKQFIEDEEPDSTNRFLVRHSSSSLLSIFGCCSSTSASQFNNFAHPEKSQPQKISIKQVIKKSGIFGMNGNTSINQSRFLHGEKKQQGSSAFLNRRVSQFSEFQTPEHSEKATPKKRSQKISLIYNKEQNDQSIHNYHTTNFIVGQYIVKPQEMNIFVKEQERQEDFNRRNHEEQEFQQKYSHYVDEDDESYWSNGGNNNFMESKNLNIPETNPNNCHFSFGQHQKAMFMNKFSGFREVCSSRPSKQSVRLGESDQIMYAQQNQARMEYPTSFSPNQRQNLCNMVRDVSIMDQEIDDSNSEKSEVIDSYQNIMSRIQQKSRVVNSKDHQRF